MNDVPPPWGPSGPPGTPTDPPPGAWLPPGGPPPPPSSSGGSEATVAIALVAGFGLMAIAALVGAIVLGVLVSPSRSEPEPDASCDPFSYIGRQPLDRCAAPGQATNVDGLALTAAPLAPGTDTYEEEALCTEVTVVNRTDESRGPFGSGWHLQRPDGRIADASIGADLTASRLAAGATTRGTVCFEPAATSDDDVVVILYDPPLTKERAAWIGPTG